MFLRVSGQLNMEAYCLVSMKVYTLGPTFRPENSNTSRRLAEVWMIEPLIAFADLADKCGAGGSALKIHLRGIGAQRHRHPLKPGAAIVLQ